MPALSEFSNVHPVVFEILRKKGYRVWYNESSDLYCAERCGWDFFADSPCGLLGLAAIYEFVSPGGYFENWWKSAGEDFRPIDNVPPAYVSVISEFRPNRAEKE